MAHEQTRLPGTQPSTRLELFGGPVLRRGDLTVRVSPLQDCLLAIAFAWGADRVPRAMAQNLLWNPAPRPLIRHRLSQLVYQTNQRCGIRIIELDREHLQVNRHEVECDLDDFRSKLESRQFEQACDMIDLGFLCALSARRTEALSDWISEKRWEQRERLKTLIRKYLDGPKSARDGALAVSAGEVLLRLNPEEEADLRRLMRASAESGHVREAEAAYGSFAERASRSGDWKPAAVTARLLKRMQSETIPTSWSEGANRDSEVPAPVVGRSDEDAVLSRAILRNKSEPGWKTIAVVGEEGVGKTRLVEAILLRARMRDHPVAQASATELESRIPLNPLIESLNREWAERPLRETPDPWKATVQSLLPGYQKQGARLPTTDHPTGGHLPRHTCEALLELFKSAAKSQCAVLFLDNFQWTDESTLAALRFLVRRWGQEPFTLVVAYRPRERRGTTFAHESDIRSLDPKAKVIRLDNLTSEWARKLVESQDARGLPEGEIARIVKLSGGNPLFLLDLTAAWPISTPGPRHRERLTVPASIHWALERRMRGLSSDAKAVVSCLCVFGHPANLQELIRLTDMARVDCVNALEELHMHCLLDWSDAGTGFRYPIFGAALYEKLSPARRALLHTRVAELLGDGFHHNGADRIALHYYWAGQRDHAYECAVRAAQGAAPDDIDKQLFFLTLARDASEGGRRRTVNLQLTRLSHRTRRLNAALERAEEVLGDPDGLTPCEIGELRLIASDARHRLGLARTDRTLEDFAEIEADATGQSGEELRAAVLDATVQLLDRVDDRDALLEQSVPVDQLELMTRPAARSRALAALSIVATLSDPDAGVRLGRQAVEVAREAALPDELALALQRLVAALAAAGRLGTVEGWNGLNEARRVHGEVGNTGTIALTLLHLADWQTVTGDYQSAGETLAEATILVADMDCPVVRTMETVVRGNLAIATSDTKAAEAALRQGLEIVAGPLDGESSAPPVPARLVLALDGLEGNMLLESGKLGLARQVARRITLSDSLEDAPLGLILLHARLASRKGERSDALTLLNRAIAANEDKRPMVWLQLAHEVVQLARRKGKPQPELAARAHATATRLGLASLAHEFRPYCAPAEGA